MSDKPTTTAAVMRTKLENPVFNALESKAKFVRAVLKSINETRLESAEEDCR